MGENSTSFERSMSLCWDCRLATGGCSWSNYLKPVKGWTAKKTIKQTMESYIVYQCPLFVRDAMNYGQKKLPKDE